MSLELSLESTIHNYDYLKYLDTLPLAKSEIFIPSLSLIYLFIVLFIGPMYMRKRQPITWIKKIIPFYNLLQVIANGYIFIYAIKDITFVETAICNLCGNNPVSAEFNKKFILLGYMWCLIKISDFLDTFFFILLKKQSHVSFLHVYHHSTTMLVAYFVYRYIHTEQSLVYAAVNCLVHVVMYSYYLLTSLGFKVKWKHLVTIMQLVQFFGMMLMTIFLLTCQQNTRYFYFSVFGLYQCTMYLYLFMKFYLKSYKHKQPSKLKNINFDENLSTNLLTAVKTKIQ
ncbi:fatty acids protein [Dasineura jujubifolia toursvirus 2a]|nr:fatty acids protein [Dasineura jujubifolia toursvirus 2a]